ncbi:hypothetical protein JW698_02380 [Candidatus Wolfebacteria bacterium]|nr:hypothetical protein [Candidatus Wolfebacteria bacterium]
MKNKTLTFFIIAVLVLIGIFIFGGLVGKQEEKPNSNLPLTSLEDFTQCLVEKGAVMYGTPWCSWCQKQKDEFGDFWQFMNYVDCSENPNECVTLGIEATPMWILSDNKKIIGYKNLRQLSQETGCELPSGF